MVDHGGHLLVYCITQPGWRYHRVDDGTGAGRRHWIAAGTKRAGLRHCRVPGHQTASTHPLVPALATGAERFDSYRSLPNRYPVG